MQFDRAVWVDEAQVYGDDPVRVRMLRDVKANILKKGMARDDVVGLLGPKTDTPKFSKHGLVYYLGPESGAISVDSQWLVIDFDDADKLVKFEVVTD